jgi:hypothetical protein
VKGGHSHAGCGGPRLGTMLGEIRKIPLVKEAKALSF